MRNTHAAFSLVELSIVLVILGLLVGGILAGQSLIRASELRAIGTEFQNYSAAVHSFRDKYFALPGDMANATAFWGKDAAVCNGHSGISGTPGSCNGDGNGSISYTAVAGATGEVYQFWKQLALAGLTEGAYSGVAAGLGGPWLVGTNTPRSRVANTGWGVQDLPNYVGDTIFFRHDYANQITFGAQYTGSPPLGVALKAEEAWNIDTKLDDGKPGAGRIIPVWWGTCTTATASTDYASNYKLDASGNVCSLMFRRWI